jgi:mRNA interferase MazF
VLTEDDGMPVRCALNLDHVALAQRAQFGEVIATLRDVRWPEVEKALLIACGFAPSEAA